jgi:hypothetical protein
MPPAEEPTSGDARLLSAARTLALDVVAGELARSFERAGIRCILLKGPAMARWLYDDESYRAYVDIDFLVPRTDLGAATKLLSQAGFELSLLESALPHGRRPHAGTWIRPGDGANVDLHDTLPGIGVSPGEVWGALEQDTERLVVGRAELDVLAEPARALLVVLHAAHHGVKDEQALTDLSHALVRLSESTWREASALASRLDAVPAFVSGLNLAPDGSLLAAALELPDASTVETRLRASSAPELALSFDWLVRAPSFRVRTRLVWRRLAPPAGVMKARSSLARRGSVGLVAAYVLNPVRLAWQAAPALRAWLSAQRR